MKHPEHVAAESFQDNLAKLTNQLAEAIAEAPSQRDAAKIGTLWVEIDRKKPQLSGVLRKLRKVPDVRISELTTREQRIVRERRDLAKVIAKQLQLWPVMDELVARHANPPVHGLFEDRPAHPLDAMLHKAHLALHALANPNAQTDLAQDHGCFADIPMPIQDFDLLITAAYRLRHLLGGTRDLRFLDVGCGGGTKVFAATRLFRWCDGLEYDPVYAAAGQRTISILCPEMCQIFQGDGVTWENYSDYDVIYFYRPLKDDALLDEMAHHIIATARPGTILLAPYDSFLRPKKGGIGCAQIQECIFVTGLSQAEADQLRHEVERTGPQKVRRAEDLRFDPGIWTPVLAAATHDIALPYSRYD